MSSESTLQTLSIFIRFTSFSLLLLRISRVFLAPPRIQSSLCRSSRKSRRVYSSDTVSKVLADFAVCDWLESSLRRKILSKKESIAENFVTKQWRHKVNFLTVYLANFLTVYLANFCNLSLEKELIIHVFYRMFLYMPIGVCIYCLVAFHKGTLSCTTRCIAQKRQCQEIFKRDSAKRSSNSLFCCCCCWCWLGQLSNQLDTVLKILVSFSLS